LTSCTVIIASLDLDAAQPTFHSLAFLSLVPHRLSTLRANWILDWLLRFRPFDQHICHFLTKLLPQFQYLILDGR
jgi:hypothetical protein